MGFLPCPICGDELDWRNVETVDIRGISVPLEYPFIDRATLMCRCGFRFVRFIRDQEPGGWKDEFEVLANRREWRCMDGATKISKSS